MNQLTPFDFHGQSIRVVSDESGEPLFVGKDICEALGYTNAADAITRHCRGIVKRYPLQTPGGVQDMRVVGEPDVMRLIVSSRLPAAQEFERLVFEEILPAIRKTGSYGPAGGMQPAFDALRMAPLALAAAKAFGLDDNAAAISANQYVRQATGRDVLAGLGQQHLVAANQVDQYFTPTELGARIGLSARKFNELLAGAGLQVKNGATWSPTAAGQRYSRLLDTSKRHGSGVPVLQVKWAASVIDVARAAAQQPLAA